MVGIQDRFPLGCRVKYTGAHPDLIGRKGTVVGEGPGEQCAHVLFDGLETPIRCSNFIRRVEPTVKELADKYRALRKEAQDIAAVLKKKGYTLKHRKSTIVRFFEPEGYLFTKYTREEI